MHTQPIVHITVQKAYAQRIAQRFSLRMRDAADYDIVTAKLQAEADTREAAGLPRVLPQRDLFRDLEVDGERPHSKGISNICIGQTLTDLEWLGYFVLDAYLSKKPNGDPVAHFVLSSKEEDRGKSPDPVPLTVTDIKEYFGLVAFRFGYIHDKRWTNPQTGVQINPISIDLVGGEVSVGGGVTCHVVLPFVKPEGQKLPGSLEDGGWTLARTLYTHGHGNGTTRTWVHGKLASNGNTFATLAEHLAAGKRPPVQRHLGEHVPLDMPR